MTKQLFFMGNGSSLWVSDGTAADTVEIIGSAGAPVTYQAGAFVPFSFGGKLLFRSNSQSGGNGLWVSDGTIGGTFEIGVP